MKIIKSIARRAEAGEKLTNREIQIMAAFLLGALVQ